MNFFSRLFESKEARAKRLRKEAEAHRLLEAARKKQQAENASRLRVAREAEAKRMEEEEESRRQRQRTCKKCQRVFEAVGTVPPKGGMCSNCGGIFCYGCMKSEFTRQMERHPEKHEVFRVRRVREGSPQSVSAKSDSLRQLMDSLQPETRVLSVADESGKLPCPECLSVVWSRSALPF